MPECVSCCFYAEIRTGRGRAAADSAPGGSGGKRGEMRAGPVQSVVPAVGPAVGSLVVCSDVAAGRSSPRHGRARSPPVPAILRSLSCTAAICLTNSQLVLCLPAGGRRGGGAAGVLRGEVLDQRME